MTEEELRAGVIDCLRRAHFMNEAFIHGEEYIRKNRAWIEWEFERKLKRMTNAEWERVIKAYIEALKPRKDGNSDTLERRRLSSVYQREGADREEAVEVSQREADRDRSENGRDDQV